MMGERHMLDNRQTESHAIDLAPTLIGATVESLENMGLLVFRNALSLVKHTNQHIIAKFAKSDRNADVPTPRRILDRILQQFGQCGSDLRDITVNRQRTIALDL